MITPRFSCDQNENAVIISICCPAVRASDVEINVDETLFSFHVNPYFLRLNFSYPLLDDDDSSSATYDPATGYFTVTLTKANRGQTFDDLDLLVKLLAPRKTNVPGPSIEVISEKSCAVDEVVESTRTMSLDENSEILEALHNDWQLPQQLEPLPSLELNGHQYGFLNLHRGYFINIQHTENEVNELGLAAENCPLPERRRRRVKHEDGKWDPEHYLADYVDDGYIQEHLRWQHPYSKQLAPFTEKENNKILNLPRREYLASEKETRDLYLILVTLLFSYCYDARTTQHEPTTESAWTTCVLTPAFSALDPPPYSADSEKDQIIPLRFPSEEIIATLVPSYRRVLAFPLYRSWALAEACRKDVAGLLALGKRVVFRCLFDMKLILDYHEVYYVYSKIWVDDFCVWTQAYASDEVLSQLSQGLLGVQIDKGLIGWKLEELEALVHNEHEDEQNTDSDDEGDSSDSD